MFFRSTLVRFRLIAILSLTQIIGWGTTFDMPGVLGRRMADSLGLANELVFGGLTVMLLVVGLAGPLTGRLMARHGPARVLALGSVLMAAGLVLLSLSEGLVSSTLAWLAIGLGGAFGLSTPAYTALVEREGLNAKRAIAILMIFTGLSSAIFWPILDLFALHWGWRATLAASASLHLVIALPLHLFALGAPLPAAAAEPREQDTSAATGPVNPREARRTFLLIAFISTVFTLVTFGISPVLIALLEQSGAAPAMAVGLASFRSVLGIAARLGDLLLGRLSTPLRAMSAACLFMLIGLAAIGLFAPAFVALAAFVVLYGFGSGIGTVARSVLPLSYVPPAAFGTMSARIQLPQNVATAFAPVVMTACLDRGGPHLVILLAATLALAVLAGLWSLSRRRPLAS